MVQRVSKVIIRLEMSFFSVLVLSHTVKMYLSSGVDSTAASRFVFPLQPSRDRSKQPYLQLNPRPAGPFCVAFLRT